MRSVLPCPVNDQSGAVLVIVMLVLLAATALSIMAIRTGTTELEVAANDKCHKIVFFAADGADEMVTEMIGQNIEMRGFETSTYGQTNIASPDFFNNMPAALPADNAPSETNYDIEVPYFGESRVYLRVYGLTGQGIGASLIQYAGYDGMAKGMAGGGAKIVYEIRSLAKGPCNGIARIWLRWLQLI